MVPLSFLGIPLNMAPPCISGWNSNACRHGWKQCWLHQEVSGSCQYNNWWRQWTNCISRWFKDSNILFSQLSGQWQQREPWRICRKWSGRHFNLQKHPQQAEFWLSLHTIKSFSSREISKPWKKTINFNLMLNIFSGVNGTVQSCIAMQGADYCVNCLHF